MGGRGDSARGARGIRISSEGASVLRRAAAAFHGSARSSMRKCVRRGSSLSGSLVSASGKHAMKAVGSACIVALCIGGCSAAEAIRPSARYGTTAAVVNGTVMVIGGLRRTERGAMVVDAVERYDPQARSWYRCAPLHEPRAFAAAAALRGVVYVFGGVNGVGKPLDSVEVYDPSANVWTGAASMGMARSHLATARTGDRGLLVGGGVDEEGRESRRVRVFNPSEASWLDWPGLPSPRRSLCLAGSSDRSEQVFAVGGSGKEGPLAVVNIFGVGIVKVVGQDGEPRWPGAASSKQPSGSAVPIDKDYLGYEWRAGPSLRCARTDFGLAVVGRRMYVVGGRCSRTPPTEVLDLENVAAGWSRAAPMPSDLSQFSLVEWGAHLLVFGGVAERETVINDKVFEYEPRVDRWSVR